MKKRIIFGVGLLIVTAFFNPLVIVFAQENTSAEEITISEVNEILKNEEKNNSEDIHLTEDIAKDLIASSTERKNLSANVDDEKIVNDMTIESEKKYELYEKSIKDANDNGEKLYTLKEILQLSYKELNISKEDMEYIKNNVLSGLVNNSIISNELMNFEDGETASKKLSEKIDELKIPQSMIFVDHSNENMDGNISSIQGFPGCVDNNGWGYKNFINSDCFWSLTWYVNCALDSSIGKAMYAARYCKYNVRNCSPLIGHSKYAHKH